MSQSAAVTWSDSGGLIVKTQHFFLQESNYSRMAYGLSIAGHGIISLLLMFGIFERIELIPIPAIPIEIVIEKPAEAIRQDALASSAVFPQREQSHPSGIPAVANVDKQAKAPRAAMDINGIDRPKQPGYDGRDLSMDKAGIPLPPASNPDTDLASGGVSAPSRAMVIAPIGPALPQMTARQPGEDELTTVKEQKTSCGAMAKRPMSTLVTRLQARVRGFPTEAQLPNIARVSQATTDRHANPNYLQNQQLFVESLDGVRRFVVLLPPGLTVNIGDVIEYEQAHIDPSDFCQFIPHLAIRKL